MYYALLFVQFNQIGIVMIYYSRYTGNGLYQTFNLYIALRSCICYNANRQKERMLSIVDDNEKPQSGRSGVFLFHFGTVAYTAG